jgi:chromosome segregation ATPase
MSGRKGWEVASVLEETEKVENKIFASYKQEIEINLNNIKVISKDIQKSNDIIRSYNPDIKIIEKELKQESINLKGNLTQLKDNVVEIPTNNISTSLDEVISNIDKLHQKANQIRSKIVSKSGHYMNEEYSSATKIRDEMISIKERYRKLKEKSTKEKHKIMEQKNKSISNIKQKNDIDQEILRLSDQATKIQEIRNQADKLKDEINKSFKSINKKLAKKFIKQQYEALIKQIDTFKSNDNKTIIAQYDNLSCDITEAKNILSQKYNKFLEQQKYSKELFQDTQAKAEIKELILIEDIVEGKDTKRTKFEYFDHYKKDNTSDRFDNIMSKAQDLIESEKFDEANKQILEANKLYEDISNQADKIREVIESSTDLAFKIRNIMLDDIHFSSVYLEPIDGNVLNGFRLECQNGDTINFEEIRYNEDGSLVVNLDHIENTSGTCGVRWQDMKDVFNQRGIPLVDVTKNGNSVIFKDKRGKKKEKNIAQRER